MLEEIFKMLKTENFKDLDKLNQQLQFVDRKEINTTTDTEGNHLINIAARFCSVEIVKFLVENLKADASKKNDLKGANNLHYSGLNPDTGVMEFFLRIEGVRNLINSPNKTDFTPLHVAVTRGTKEHVEMLLSNGADLSVVVMPQNFSILQYALNNPDHGLAVCEALIEKGANINHRDANSFTPLHMAAGLGNKDILNLLISKKANLDTRAHDGFTPLLAALNDTANSENENLRTSYKEFAKILIEGMTLSELNSPLTLADYSFSYLLKAVSNNQEEIVECLIKKGVDINCLDTNGVSPIYLACRFGFVNIVKMLLQSPDCDVSIQDQDLNTPLHLAVAESSKELTQTLHLVSQDHREIASILLQSPNCNVNIQNRDLNTPLHLAVSTGCVTIVRMLLQHQAINITKVNAESHDPLDKAMMKSGDNKYKIVPLFLDKIQEQDKTTKLDNYPQLTYSKGKNVFSILHSAAYSGFLNIVNILLQRSDCDVNMQDEELNTPLHLAVAQSHAEIVRVLLEHPAIDITKVNAESYDPLSKAMRKPGNNKYEIVQLFLDKIQGQDKTTKLDNYIYLVHSTSIEKADLFFQIFNYCNINAQGGEQNSTALHYAVYFGKIVEISHFLKYKAKFFLKDVYGKTAFDYLSSDTAKALAKNIHTGLINTVNNFPDIISNKYLLYVYQTQIKAKFPEAKVQALDDYITNNFAALTGICKEGDFLRELPYEIRFKIFNEHLDLMDVPSQPYKAKIIGETAMDN